MLEFGNIKGLGNLVAARIASYQCFYLIASSRCVFVDAFAIRSETEQAIFDVFLSDKICAPLRSTCVHVLYLLPAEGSFLRRLSQVQTIIPLSKVQG